MKTATQASKRVMQDRTIQAGPKAIDRISARPAAVTAALLVAIDALIAATGAHAAALSACVLLLAPGLAWLPLLPARARARPLSALAAAPVLSFAIASPALITAASAGVPLTGLWVRVVIAAVVAGGLAAFADGEPWAAVSRQTLLAAAGLLVAVAAGIVLQDRVIGGTPVPGNDWPHYVLYADEIRAHHALLIDNPFWMLGVPFREDPGVPALYGAWLAMTDQPAVAVVHGIWLFAVMGILSAYVLVSSLWGATAGVIAAALWAVLPIDQDILGWHGLPNVAALALLALALLYCAALVEGTLGRREQAGFALALIALAATHRLSFLLGLAIVGLAVLAAFATRRRPPIVGAVVGTVACAAILCPGVAYDLVTRSRTFGGTQSYTAYLSSKVALGAVARDLTWVFTVVAIASVLVALAWARRDRALRMLLGGLAVIAALAYAWVVHVPLVYFRMAYFLPLVLVPIVAVVLVRLLGSRRAAVAGGVLAAVIAGFAWGQAENVRRFYAFLDPASLRGLDAVASQLHPREVVVTDRCWSFLGTWLLRTRTLPALDSADIQPKAEAVRAAEAHAVLAGTPSGRRLARRLGVRFLLTDPECTDARGRPIRTEPTGRAVFASRRLVVLELGPRL